MSDTFAHLTSQAWTRRTRWDKVPWATLAIELSAFSRKDRCFVGIALVDRRLVGWLVNGEPRSFRVEPGEHTVTVYLARSARIGPIVKKTVSGQFVLQPRETVRIVCGRTNQTSDNAQAFMAARRRLMAACFAGAILAAILGWLLWPLLREAVAYVTITLGVREPWLSLFYFAVSSRLLTAWLASHLGGGLASYAVLHAQASRSATSREPRECAPYFLLQQPIIGTDTSAGQDRNTDDVSDQS